MNFLKSRAFLMILGTVLLFAVGALLIYGISSRTEVGMMPETPDWHRSDFPLKVCAHPYADSMGYAENSAAISDATAAARFAVNVTNTRLGFRAFSLGTSCEDVDITVGVPAEHGWLEPGGDAVITSKHCSVQTANVHGELRDLVLQHELGHCLGLGHDSYEQSIMRKVQIAPAAGELPPWISDSDRALLRTTYSMQ